MNSYNSKQYFDKHKCLPWLQGSYGQHGAHLGPVVPRWVPCRPHDPCYLGMCTWFSLTLALHTTITVVQFCYIISINAYTYRKMHTHVYKYASTSLIHKYIRATQYIEHVISCKRAWIHTNHVLSNLSIHIYVCIIYIKYTVITIVCMRLHSDFQIVVESCSANYFFTMPL